MRIGILHSHFTILVGVYKVTIDLANSLSNKGHEVIIYTQKYQDLSYHPLNSDIKLFEIGYFLPKSPLYWLNLRYVIKKYLKLLNKQKFDVIITGTFPENYVSVCYEKTDFKLYYCQEPYRFFHDKEFLKKNPLKIQTTFKFLKPLYKNLDIIGGKYQDKIITNGISSQKRILKAYSRKSDIVFPGVRLDVFKPLDMNYISRKFGLKSNKILFCLGYSHESKGMTELLNIFKLIQEKNPDCYLIIGGKISTSNMITFKTIVKKLLINEKFIIFTGFISEKELPYFYSSSSILLYTSIDEAFGLPPIESMACETPVIAFSGGPSSTISNNKTGYLIKNKNILEFSEKVNYLLNNPQIANEMGKEGLKSVKEKFSWKITMNKIDKIIN